MSAFFTSVLLFFTLIVTSQEPDASPPFEFGDTVYLASIKCLEEFRKIVADEFWDGHLNVSYLFIPNKMPLKVFSGVQQCVAAIITAKGAAEAAAETAAMLLELRTMNKKLDFISVGMNSISVGLGLGVLNPAQEMARNEKEVGKKSPQELIAGFNSLRGEQRSIASKIYELESDMKEHKLLIENLKTRHEGLKGYWMIRGILIERTVKDVLPDLETYVEQLKHAVDELNKTLLDKGKEIQDYQGKNNVKFQVRGFIMLELESGEGGEEIKKAGAVG